MGAGDIDTPGKALVACLRRRKDQLIEGVEGVDVDEN
jgi:hypothetical protein